MNDGNALMSRFGFCLLAAMWWLLGGDTLFAQQLAVKQSVKSYTLMFRIDSQELDTAYAANGAVAGGMLAELEWLLSAGNVAVDSVVITSSASPDGNRHYNRRLSVKRGQSVYSYLKDGMPALPEEALVLVPQGEDWTAFRRVVEGDGELPCRQEILDITDTDLPVDEKERRIKRLKQAYAYLVAHHLHKLRAVTVAVHVTVREAVLTSPAWSLPAMRTTAAYPAPDGFCQALPAPDGRKHFRLPPFAVKTNLLYDAALVPNVGLEFFFRERWSVGLNWMYAWWKTDRRHYYWRIYGGDVEARYWLGSDGYGPRRSGHHLGVYAQTGTFDFELGGRGYMVDRWGYGGGLSYGYSLPVGRRLNLDFSIGLGLFHGQFKEYLPIDGRYVWQLTKKLNWIGPTKAEVSLVWHLGDMGTK